jgi:hypothetical protein
MHLTRSTKPLNKQHLINYTSHHLTLPQHLLPDAVESLDTVWPEAGLAYPITCFGIILVLITEQVTFLLMKTKAVAVTAVEVEIKAGTRKLTYQSEEGGYSSSNFPAHVIDCQQVDNHDHDHDHGGSGRVENMKNTDSVRDLITAYIMELSIAVHSIIIGIDLGLLGHNDMSTLVPLVIVLSFHQFLGAFHDVCYVVMFVML